MNSNNPFPPLGLFSRLPYEVRLMIWKPLVSDYFSSLPVLLRPNPDGSYPLPPILRCSTFLRDEITYYIEREMELMVSIHIFYAATRDDRVCVKHDLLYQGRRLACNPPWKPSRNIYPWKNFLITLFNWKPHASLNIHFGISRRHCACRRCLWCETRLDSVANQEMNLLTFSDTVDWIVNAIRKLPNQPNVRVELLNPHAKSGWVEDGKPIETFRSYPDYELGLLPFLRLRRWELQLPEDLRKLISDHSDQSHHSIFHKLQFDSVPQGQWWYNEFSYRSTSFLHIRPQLVSPESRAPTTTIEAQEYHWWRVRVFHSDALLIYKRLSEVRSLFRQHASSWPTLEYNYRAFLYEDLTSLSIPAGFDTNLSYQAHTANSVIEIIDGPPGNDGSIEVESISMPEADRPNTNPAVISKGQTRIIQAESAIKPEMTLEDIIMSKMEPTNIEYAPDNDPFRYFACAYRMWLH